MTDSNHNDVDSETIDTGEPITQLREMEEPASRTFSTSLNRRIQRRMLVSDVGRLSWNGPVRVIIELLSMIFGLFGADRPDKQKEG